MRFFLTGAVATFLLGAGYAEGQQPRASIESVGISLQSDSTSIMIETSGDTPLRIVPQADRVDIELPQAAWHAKPPEVDRHAGLIESFRRVPAAQGTHIVFMTRSEYGVRDSGPVATAANGDRIYTITLGAPSTAPLVTVTGEGPVVIQGSGYIPSPSKAAPAVPVQPSAACTPKLTQQGSIDGKPVLGFGGCPSNATP